MSHTPEDKAIPLPDKQPDEKEHKEDIPLTGPIKKLADAMEAKGVRPVFGLQPDQIKLIEETFKDQPDLFNERLWEQVGKKISWYPLTAMCWYMKHLAKEKAHKQESEEQQFQKYFVLGYLQQDRWQTESLVDAIASGDLKNKWEMAKKFMEELK